MNDHLQTSANGLARIVAHEGAVKRGDRHVPYNDPVGYATIGYGHLIHKSAVDGCDVCWRTLSEDEARALLAKDIVRFERGVKRHITVPLNQNQFDALVSFSFNLGEHVLDPTDCTLSRKLNAGDVQGAADEFPKWVKAAGKTLDGLVTRRADERALFLAPVPVALKGSPSVNPIVLLVRHSRLVLDVASRGDGSHDPGARLVQNGVHCLPNQRFVVEPLDNDQVRIRCAGSGLVLDVVGFSKENGAEVQVWYWHGGANQRWRFVPQGAGYVIESVNAPGKVLDVAGFSLDRGGLVHIWDRLNNDNQVFEGLWTSDTATAKLAEQPAPPVTQNAGTISASDAAAQIERWGFEDGVAGFQQAFAFEDLDVDGKVGPKTIAAVQRVVDSGGKLSEFFAIGELRSKGNGKVRSHRALLRRLDEVRRRKGSFTPVSGYRDPAHNKRVGGASNSQHVYGTACDIPEGLGLTVAEARDVGFSGIGRCGNIVLHGDVRAEGPNNTTGGRPGNPTVWDYC